MADGRTADEWRRHPMLPIAAALGLATSVIHYYGLGPYIDPISQSFGWPKSKTVAGLTAAMVIQAALAIPMGYLVDRYGPRSFALFGIILLTSGFGFLSTATGGDLNWLVLWAFIGVASAPTQAIVWTSAVTTSFDHSRGAALGVTMCGGSLGAAVFPILAAWLIEAHGWRTALILENIIWASIAFPIIFFFFRKKPIIPTDKKPIIDNPNYLKDVSILSDISSWIYIRIILITFISGLTMMSLAVNFISIVSGHGASAIQAAGIASLVGLSAIAGRLGTGPLLDKFRASFVGSLCLIFPVISCSILLNSDSGILSKSVAAILLGLSLGCEGDVFFYLVSRYFGLRKFATLSGGNIMAVFAGASIGPLAATRVYDVYGSYNPFLWFSMSSLVLCSALAASLPRPADRSSNAKSTL